MNQISQSGYEVIQQVHHSVVVSKSFVATQNKKYGFRISNRVSHTLPHSVAATGLRRRNDLLSK